MTETVHTRSLYEDPIRLKTVGILAGFIVFGIGVGLSEGELDILYPFAGLFTGVIAVVFSAHTKTGYTLKEDCIAVGISIFGVNLPTVNGSMQYEDISGLEMEWDPPYNIGENVIGDLESHHYNVGGEHIRIKSHNRKDLTFSASEDDLEVLRKKLEAVK